MIFPIVFRKKQERHTHTFFLTCMTLAILLLTDSSNRWYKWYSQMKKNQKVYNIHFTTRSHLEQFVPFQLNVANYFEYIENQGIVGYIIKLPFDYKVKITPPHLDSKEVSPFIHSTSIKEKTNMNLIVILVESFESWTMENICEKEIAPNFKKLTTHPNVAYFPKIKSQVLYGSSGDGQMIVNTGLLPINKGAACMIYGYNHYPNFAHFYESSLIINPAPHIWNQDICTKSYGYKNELKKSMNDANVFNVLKSTEKKDNFCIFTITVSMHAPFEEVKCDYLNFPKDMPPVMNKYLNCTHYTDSCFGDFWNKFEKDPIAKNTVVVITGDHIIFQKNFLTEFSNFSNKHNLSIKNMNNYIPLIIYSPEINENTIIDETCYQMDIFPTIMHLIGIDEYYWKGLGVNILDINARKNRPISEENAYELSDKLIRNNYFKEYQEKK